MKKIIKLVAISCALCLGNVEKAVSMLPMGMDQESHISSRVSSFLNERVEFMNVEAEDQEYFRGQLADQLQFAMRFDEGRRVIEYLIEFIESKDIKLLFCVRPDEDSWGLQIFECDGVEGLSLRLPSRGSTPDTTTFMIDKDGKVTKEPEPKGGCLLHEIGHYLHAWDIGLAEFCRNAKRYDTDMHEYDLLRATFLDKYMAEVITFAEPLGLAAADVQELNDILCELKNPITIATKLKEPYNQLARFIIDLKNKTDGVRAAISSFPKAIGHEEDVKVMFGIHRDGSVNRFCEGKYLFQVCGKVRALHRTTDGNNESPIQCELLYKKGFYNHLFT